MTGAVSHRRYGKRWYVDNSLGTGTNAGTSWVNAWRTIAAISWTSIGPGDTLLISGGASGQTYNEVMLVGAHTATAARPLTITGAKDSGKSGTVTINGGGTRRCIDTNSKNNMTIQNFTCQNTTDSAVIANTATAALILQNLVVTLGVTGAGTTSHPVGIDIHNCTGAGSITVRRCTVSSLSDNSTDQTDCIYISGSNGFLVDGCTVTQNNPNGTGHSDCIQLTAIGSGVLSNNQISQNAAGSGNNHGIIASDATTGTTLSIYNNVIITTNGSAPITHFTSTTGVGGKAFIYNNTLYTNFWGLSIDYTTLGVGNRAVPTEIKNNIIYMTSGSTQAYAITNWTISSGSQINNNCVFCVAGVISNLASSWPSWQGLGYDAQGINSDPLFTTNGSNFVLQSGSPAKDAAATLASVPQDILGFARPIGAAYSMGAYEQPQGASNLTAGGVPIPSGWALQRLDTFGTANSVPGPIRLHTLYNEAIFFDQDGTDRIQIPNTGINNQQQQYQHFEDATWLFMSDRLRIQGRGQGDNSIKSGQMETNGFGRSFIFEARLTAPATLGSWVEYWVFADSGGGSTSEIDVEIVISNPAGSGSNLDVHSYSIGNIGDSGQVITTDDSHVTVDVPSGSGLVLYRNAALNVSTGPHYYTTLYDDTGPGQIRRYLDGVLLYHATWKWNATMGGTGFGPDPAMILDLAVGGVFPGNIATPSAYSGDLDIYSIGYYTPAAAGRAIPVGQAWNFNLKAASVSLSGGDLIATGTVTADSIVCALDGMYTGKYYWEVILSNNNGSAGIVSHTNDRTDTYLGDFGAGVGWYGSGRGSDAGVWFQGANAATWEVYSTTPVRLCFALHVVVGVSCKLWGRVGAAGNWNNDVIGNQNPATDLGGFAMALSAGALVKVRPAVDLATSGDTATLVAASGSWVGTPPVGFGPIGPT